MKHNLILLLPKVITIEISNLCLLINIMCIIMFVLTYACFSIFKIVMLYFQLVKKENDEN